MPSRAVRTFTDPDQYVGSIQATTAELTITARGHFTAQLTRIKLHHLWMQRYSENLPRIGHYANIPGRAIIVFRTKPGPSLLTAGSEMHMNNIIRHTQARDYFRRSDGLACFGSMSLPVEEMAIAGDAIVGCDLMPPNQALTIIPPPLAMATLQRLHAAAGTLAEDAPAVLAHPEATRGLEQALIEAMVGCLGLGAVREDRSALRQHEKIMRRFHTVVEETVDQPLYIPELCKAIGASERVLRICCQEQLGIGAKRYLLLRRMHLVRRALRESAPSGTTVTEIAMRYGFWQLGRFAGEYKALFGESPSTMLARPCA